MEAVAKLRNHPTSTRKMRLMADLVRGKKVEQALDILKFQPNYASKPLEKLIFSAVNNWEQGNQGQRVEDAELYIKTIFVDGGTILKRLRPRAQGRANRIRKRSNHVTVIIDSKNISESNIDTPEVQEDKEIKE